MKDYHAFEVGEREAAEERYQDEQDRRDRHMPVIMESDDVDVAWRPKDEKHTKHPGGPRSGGSARDDASNLCTAAGATESEESDE